MKILEVYLKYAHLDRVFTDERLLVPGNAMGQAIYDLWAAIKAEAQPQFEKEIASVCSHIVNLPTQAAREMREKGEK